MCVCVCVPPPCVQAASCRVRRSRADVIPPSHTRNVRTVRCDTARPPPPLPCPTNALRSHSQSHGVVRRSPSPVPSSARAGGTAVADPAGPRRRVTEPADRPDSAQRPKATGVRVRRGGAGLAGCDPLARPRVRQIGRCPRACSPPPAGRPVLTHVEKELSLGSCVRRDGVVRGRPPAPRAVAVLNPFVCVCGAVFGQGVWRRGLLRWRAGALERWVS